MVRPKLVRTAVPVAAAVLLSVGVQAARNGARADAYAGNERIPKTGTTEFLIPSPTKPQNRQIDQDRQCRAGFNNETAKTFANAIGSKAGKDLMRAVKDGRNNRIPKPRRHRRSLAYEMDHSREN